MRTCAAAGTRLPQQRDDLALRGVRVLGAELASRLVVLLVPATTRGLRACLARGSSLSVLLLAGRSGSVPVGLARGSPLLARVGLRARSGHPLAVDTVERQQLSVLASPQLDRLPVSHVVLLRQDESHQLAQAGVEVCVAVLQGVGRQDHDHAGRIAKAGRPLARLVPLARHTTPRPLGFLTGQVTIGPDFDAPLPDAIRHSFEGEVP